MLPGYAVYIAAVINAGGVTGYIRDTLRGNTFPHRITWFLWGFIPLVTVAVQLREHVGIQTVMTFSYFATAMAVLVMSFVARRGSWEVTPFDWACGGVCVAAVAVYAATLKGDLAISLLLTAEFFAALPTVRKSWKAPETETWTVFLAGVVQLEHHAARGEALDVPDLRLVLLDRASKWYPGRAGPRLSRPPTQGDLVATGPALSGIEVRPAWGASRQGALPQISMASR